MTLKAGNDLGAGIGIVIVLLERRIFDGKPGVQGERQRPLFQSPILPKGLKLLPGIFYLYATNPNK